MQFNKITLAFSQEVESLFLKKYYSDSIFQFRIAFILVIILYGLFGYLDTRVISEYATTFHVIRFVFVIPILLIVFLLSFTALFQKIWQVLLFISFIASGCGISIMTILAPENYGYYGGMMLVFFAGYFFIKLRFFMATIAGWSILLIYNIGAIYYSHTPEKILLNNNFFFISANIIGMFAAYYIEYYTRRNFILNRKLDHEKLLVLNANKNLELKVRKRTEELLKAKEKAEESDRLKSAFLTNMSHEIRTPINGILGFTNLLQKPDLTHKKHQKYIDIIEKSGHRLLNTVNNIIDISRIETGSVEISISEVNINEQFEYLHLFFTPEATKKEIQLKLNNDLAEENSIIKTDLEKFNSIFINLMKNAIKFTNEGFIEFGCRQKRDEDYTEFEFYVKDSGIGIPSNKKHAVFERFVQADIENKNAVQGSGLGLSISKAYVQMLGGKIWVDSEEGKGSTFYFTLKDHSFSESESITKNKGQILKDDITFGKLNILIVEDDEISREFISIIVEPYSNEIIDVSSGLEAIETCRNNADIDLILMDIQMSGMNGYEATRQIRKFNKEVIIIAQTAFALTGDKEKAINIGCNDYISKPIDETELLNLLKRHFGK